jgi:heme exporter protein C
MKARLPLTILIALLIFAAGYAALFIAPDEKTMHAIQRIFYFHLPSWIAMCCTIGLITGPLWARPVWGIWWTWDARLTSTFILWLLFIAYLLLRGLIEDPEKKASLSAIFGIFASLDIPLVYLSNRLWRTQHPQPVILGGPNSGLAPMIARVLLLCVIAVFCVMILVLVDRYRLETLRNECAELRFAIESRASDSARASEAALGKVGR